MSQVAAASAVPVFAFPPEEPVEAIMKLDAAALINRFARGLETMDRRMFELSDAQLDTAFLPDANVGRWSVRVLLGHLADAELVYIHRIRRAVGEDRPVVALWDENSFIDTGIYGGPDGGGSHPIGAFLAVIHTLRRWTAEWLGTLTPQQWDREILHPERGPMSVKRLVAGLTWHLEHHARYLNAKVARILGAPQAAPRKGGCCGPGCGCH